jgi:hypothetical protein
MRLFFPLSGDDVFISYSRRDGALYAAGLADELTKRNLSCFIDKLGVKPNHDLPPDLIKKIKSCSVFVLVGTEKAAQSEFVKKEIAIFKETGRTILPIDFNGSVGNAIWYEEIPGLAVEHEKNPDALETGNPSENVNNFIEKSFNYTRRNQYMFRMFWGALSIFLVLVALSLGGVFVARNQIAKAAAATKKADDATELANRKEAEAVQKTEEARIANEEAIKSKEEAKKATEEAKKQTELATEKTKLADAATKRAEEQTKKADEATQRAEQQRQLADAATKEAARQTKLVKEGKSTISQNYYNIAQSASLDESLNALPWIQKAIETAPEDDKNLSLYKYWALNLTKDVPRLMIRPSGGLGQEPVYDGQSNKMATVSSSGKLSLWNLKTGERISDLLEKCDCEIHRIYPEDSANYQGGGIPSGGNPIFSSDGQLIAALTEEANRIHLHIWNTSDGTEILDLQDPRFSTNYTSFYFQNFRFTPDSKGIFFDIRNDEPGIKILVLDARTGKDVNTLSSQRIPYPQTENAAPNFGTAKLPISPNSERNRILTIEDEADGQTAVIRDLFTGKIEGKTLLPKNLEFIDFTGGGGRLVMVNRDESGKRQISAFDIGKGTVIEPARFATGIQQEHKILGFSKDDNRLIVDCGNINLYLWDLNEKREKMYGDLYVAKKNIKAFFTDDESQIVFIFETPDSTPFGNKKHNVFTIDLTNGRRFYSQNIKGEVNISSSGRLIFQNTGDSILVKEIKNDENQLPTNNSNISQFPLEANECLIKASKIPQRKAILTFTLSPCSPDTYNFSSTVSMQLRDLETGKPKWNTKSIILGTATSRRAEDYIVTFSPSGKSFSTAFPGYQSGLNYPSSDQNRDLKTLLVWETETGKSLQNFEPIRADIGAASFNSDESKLTITVSDSERIWHIYQIQLADGETIRQSRLGARRNNYLPVLTRDGGFAALPRSETEITIRNLQTSADRVIKFTNPDSAFLAAELLKKADKISIINNNNIQADFAESFAVTISDAGDLNYIANSGEIIPLLSPPTTRYFRNLSLSANGKFVMDSSQFSINLFESQTRLPLLKNLSPKFSGGFIYTEIFPGTNEILTIEGDGKVNLLKIDSSAKGIPVWLTNLDGALSGLKIINGISAEPLSQEKYLDLRNKYRESLVSAAKQGDLEASIILRNWNP